MRCLACCLLSLPLALGACSGGAGDLSDAAVIPVPDAAVSMSDAAPDAAPEPTGSLVADIPLEAPGAMDLLFVIDDSGSMAQEQVSLAYNFSRVISVLQGIEGGLPDLHIGVISPDMGAGPYNIQGCVASGDDGVLQNDVGPGCAAMTDRYLVDSPDGAGGRETNYDGSLQEAFSCIAELGITGCGFEQPLAAMRRALDGSQPLNAGFLRDDAVLAVVFLTDEDDCSAKDVTLYDTDPANDTLGPLSSFRCFEHGVVCEPDEPRQAGAKASCRSREDSVYTHSIASYVEFLRGLKADPSRVLVAGIFGNPTPVVVGSDDQGRPELQPSCQSAAGDAVPAVRLAELLAAFPGRSAQSTICNEDLSDALATVGTLLSQSLGAACLGGSIADADPATPAIEPTCEVRLVSMSGPDQLLPACDEPGDPAASSNKPCHVIAPDPALCAATETELAVRVYREGAPAADERLRVYCEVP